MASYVGTASDQDSDASQRAAYEAAVSNAKQELGDNITVGFTQYRTKIEGEAKPYLYVSTCTIVAEPAAAPEEPTPVSQPTGEDKPEGSTPVSTETTTPATTETPAATTTFDEIVTTAARPTPSYPTAPDWRFRVSLAPKADYFYNAADPGILAPLKATKGVIFPYTPSISVSYVAKYDTQTPTHSNFSINNYQHSSVEQVTVEADFTAQDIMEANYLLAVIHFFKSATKMFYGKDLNPARGVPPPLLYLTGFGQYQFDNHPVVLTNFTYKLPVDVDYINAYPNGVEVGVNGAQLAAFNQEKKTGDIRAFIEKLRATIMKGNKKASSSEAAAAPKLSQALTRVPTKMSISLTFQPIVTRNAISNEFSLKDYASGKLLRGSQNPKTGGGIW
jgi:hypothetical protein